MRLQQKTDLGLRVLIYLADSGGATPAEIAEAHQISASHVAKVMQALSAAGFIHAERGRGKKARLAAGAAARSVADVVRTLEPMEIAECFREEPQCALTGRCVLQGALQEAYSAFLATLESISLAELSNRATKKLVQIG